MKKKLLSLTALFLVLCMMASMMFACSKDDEDEDDEDEEETEEAEDEKDDKDDEDKDDEDKDDETKPDETKPEGTKPEATQPEATQPEATQPEATQPEATQPEATQPETTPPVVTPPVDKPENPNKTPYEGELVIEKVGLLHSGDSYITATDAGVYYKDYDAGKYGIISYEGLYDSGAIYYDCSYVHNYFEVQTKLPANSADIAAINSTGLVDGKGNVVVPANYADISWINERYMKVITVTAITESDDDKVLTVYYSGGETVKYTGTWCVYDYVAGKEISSIGSSVTDYAYASGNYLTYTDYSNNRYTVDHNGNSLPEHADLFSDGYYTVEGLVGDAYDKDGKKLFSYDLTGFIPYEHQGEYFLAKKYTTEGKSKYVVMDETGKVVSAEYPSYISIEGAFIEADNVVYDFQGNELYKSDADYISVYADTFFGDVCMVSDDGKYVMLGLDGTVYNEFPKEDGYYIDTTNFTFGKEKEDDYGYNYYSFADGDFTIDGNSIAPWLAYVEVDNFRYDLVNTITGEILLKGYAGYDVAQYSDYAYYIYAEYTGGAEVYLVTAAGNFVDVETKKEDLYEDLANAFAAESINVTVNKETGEVALDTGVLFGGDSAELTAEGKAFLDKFIKAYNKVITADKYKGFITKTLVEGHVAPTGESYASGLQLSIDRATNVLNYCLSADTSAQAEDFEAVGYSNSQPVYDAAGNVDMAASRRVAFRFLINAETV